MLPRFEFNFYTALARIEILKRNGTSFQDFFVEVGHHRWHPDFEGRRAQGSIGDKKCDGYRPSTGTVFQCYAPRQMQPKPLCKKIKDDHGGALANRKGTPIKRWVLVHNDSADLPTEAHELIITLRSTKGGVPIEIMGPENLLSLIMELSSEKLALLFPHGLSSDDIRKVQYRDIDDLVQSLGDLTSETTSESVDAPSAQKILHNGLSESVIGILKHGFLVQRTFANYFADTSRAVAGTRIADKFKRLYSDHKKNGLEADQIFFELIDSVGGLACAKPRRAAIVGLVSYMFHSCEIFENAPNGSAT